LSIDRADIAPVQLLVRRPRWPRHKLCLPEQLHLPHIARGIFLVPPPTLEIQPPRRRALAIRREGIRARIKAIHVRRQGRVPVRALLGVVLEHAAGQIEVGDCVVVGPRDGVICMRALGRVGDRAAVGCFLDGGVCEGLAVGVLRVPDCLWDAVGEAHHGMFPVTDVVACGMLEGVTGSGGRGGGPRTEI
jgi:hypothetical protein